MNMFTRGHISQSLSRLQKKGLVRMEQDQEDRRCTHNYLTEGASAVIRKIEKISKKIREIILDRGDTGRAEGVCIRGSEDDA